MKKGCLKITGLFAAAAVCLGASALMFTRFPDAWDGQVLNPVIALAKYALPAVALLLLLEGTWRLGLAPRGSEQRCLAATVIVRMQQRWDRRDRELYERLLRKPDQTSGITNDSVSASSPE